jgi:hypothetical protein
MTSLQIDESAWGRLMIAVLAASLSEQKISCARLQLPPRVETVYTPLAHIVQRNLSSPSSETDTPANMNAVSKCCSWRKHVFSSSSAFGFSLLLIAAKQAHTVTQQHNKQEHEPQVRTCWRTLSNLCSHAANSSVCTRSGCRSMRR